jgi:hypothetical protein
MLRVAQTPKRTKRYITTSLSATISYVDKHMAKHLMYLFGRIRGGRGMVQVRPDSLVLAFSVLAGRDKAAASRRRVLIRQQLGHTQLNHLVLNASVLADWSAASLVNVKETNANATMQHTRCHMSTPRIALMRVNRYNKAAAVKPVRIIIYITLHTRRSSCSKREWTR